VAEECQALVPFSIQYWRAANKFLQAIFALLSAKFKTSWRGWEKKRR
jgi:hypothetical protein